MSGRRGWSRDMAWSWKEANVVGTEEWRCYGSIYRGSLHAGVEPGPCKVRRRCIRTRRVTASIRRCKMDPVFFLDPVSVGLLFKVFWSTGGRCRSDSQSSGGEERTATYGPSRRQPQAARKSWSSSSHAWKRNDPCPLATQGRATEAVSDRRCRNELGVDLAQTDAALG